MVLRSWQAAEGADRYPETLCLAGSYHSIYGAPPALASWLAADR